jgi:hypothetical protein
MAKKLEFQDFKSRKAKDKLPDVRPACKLCHAEGSGLFPATENTRHGELCEHHAAVASDLAKNIPKIEKAFNILKSYNNKHYPYKDTFKQTYRKLRLLSDVGDFPVKDKKIYKKIAQSVQGPKFLRESAREHVDSMRAIKKAIAILKSFSKERKT